MISRLNSPAYAYPCPCFACALTSANAGLGVTVDSYSVDVGLFHPLLPAGLSRRTLTSHARASQACGLTFPERPDRRSAARAGVGSPGSRAWRLSACLGGGVRT